MFAKTQLQQEKHYDHQHTEFSNSLISNTSFINTFNNESCKNINNPNQTEIPLPIKSKRSEQEESYQKDTYTYDYSISNISNSNQTVLGRTSHREKIIKEIPNPSNFHKENTKHYEKNEENESKNMGSKIIFLEGDSHLLENKLTILDETTLKIKSFEKNMKIINQNKNHILEEIKNELQDSEKETLDYYKEYFIKFKNLTLTKLKSVHLALEEVSNERDEYKDIMEAMILENEEKENDSIFKQKEINEQYENEIRIKNDFIKQEEEKKFEILEENKKIKEEIIVIKNELESLKTNNQENELIKCENKKLLEKNQELQELNTNLMIKISELNKEFVGEIINRILDQSINNSTIKNLTNENMKINNQLISKEETICSFKEEISKLQQNLSSQKNSYESKIKQYEDKLNLINQKDQMKASVLSSFNKKMALIKTNNNTPENINTSYNDVINSSSSNATLKGDNNNTETSLNNSMKLNYNMQALIKNLNFLREEKQKVKNSIKEWIDEFEKTEKRVATNDDKRKISNLYSLHNNFTQQIKVFEDKLDNIKNLKAQINKTNIENFNKSKSVSPRKAHLAKIMQINRNSNISNSIMNVSIENQSFLQNNQSNIINTSINQSFDISTSQKNIQLDTNELNKVLMENKNLKNEVSILKINNEEKNLKNKSLSLTNENTLITEENEENHKSIIVDHEQKYNKKLKDIEDNYKKKINEIIKSKDLFIKKMQQDLIKLKGEYEKNNLILFQSSERLLEEKKNWLSCKCNLEAQLKNEIAIRKTLHNYVEDMKGKIRVYCRVRPMLPSEIERNHKTIVQKKDEFTMNVETKQGIKTYKFDSIFDEKSSQEEIFEDTKRLIQSVIDGYNVCVFAYGQTGSGKSFTMQGNQENPGIMSRSISEMFKLLEPFKQTSQISMNCHIVEVYVDTLIDLLSTKEHKNGHLEIKEDYKGMTYIQNVTIVNIQSKEELEKTIKVGINNRKTGKTDMNDESSRSHLIVTITIEISNKEKDIKTFGKLSLIDLAGSERVSKSNPTIKQLNETRGINKSLSALGNVISALADQENTGKDRFIPYRDNKLTLLMKDSLGGNSKTLMFLNIPPNDFNLDETINSLYYGDRVKCITNESMKNTENKEMIRLKENFRVILEENENLKKAFKKTLTSGKDNLKILLNNSSTTENHIKSLENQTISENFNKNESQHYSSMI